MNDYLQQLTSAINTHDLDAMVGCFAAGYRNETPVHPARSFTGAEQVRQNWAQIFGGIPDIRATVVREVVDGDTVWAELELAGTRRDGVAHMLRGVTVLGVRDGRAEWARFYLEPVDDAEVSVGDHLARTVAG